MLGAILLTAKAAGALMLVAVVIVAIQEITRKS